MRRAEAAARAGGVTASSPGLPGDALLANIAQLTAIGEMEWDGATDLIFGGLDRAILQAEAFEGTPEENAAAWGKARAMEASRSLLMEKWAAMLDAADETVEARKRKALTVAAERLAAARAEASLAISLPAALAAAGILLDPLSDPASRVEPVPARHTAATTKLPAYYPAPEKDRDAVLARQEAVIRRTVTETAALKILRHRIRTHAAKLLDGDLDPTPGEKGMATRRSAMEITGAPLSALPDAPRRMITGSQGTRKTQMSLEAVAAIRLPDGMPFAAAFFEPTLDMALEAEATYRGLISPGSLPGMMLRGRNALDPKRPGHRMCDRSEAAAKVAKAGYSVKQTLGGTCPLAGSCGTNRQAREVAALNGRGVFLGSSRYLYLSSAVPNFDLVVSDEDAVMPTVEIIRIPFSKLDPYGFNGIGISTRDTLNTIRTKISREPHAALAAIRAAGIDAGEIATVRNALNIRLDAMMPGFSGQSSDAEITAALDSQPEHGRLRAALSLLLAIEDELGMPRPSFNAITANRKEEIIVSRLHRLRGTRKAGFLVLDGTGDPELARHVFGDRLEHHRFAIERMAYVTGTRGKEYSRQSITGLDRNGEARSARLAEEARVLREDIGTISGHMTVPPLVIANKRVLEALALPDDAPRANFGGLRGKNRWKQEQAVLSVGREAISIEAAEHLGRAFLARDPEPFLSMGTGNYVKVTRGRRMRDGTVSPITVLIHPDPRIQRVVEQVREAEVIQGIDRVRSQWNHREITLLNGLCLDVTYDVIRSHAHLVAGGTPGERAFKRNGILPHSPRDAHRMHPDIFRTEKQAEHALRNYPLDPKKYPIERLGGVSYRRQGQHGPEARATIDLDRHPHPSPDTLAALGPLRSFQGVRCDGAPPWPRGSGRQPAMVPVWTRDHGPRPAPVMPGWWPTGPPAG